MKTCSYCGRENPENVTQCQECGIGLPVREAASSAEASQFTKIAVLQDESEAERLHIELEREEIPHVMVSYEDPAFAGIFQTAKGWGHIEANEENKDAILSTLEDIRKIEPLASDELPDSSQP
jgi:hypothetical protein